MLLSHCPENPRRGFDRGLCLARVETNWLCRGSDPEASSGSAGLWVVFQDEQ